MPNSSSIHISSIDEEFLYNHLAAKHIPLIGKWELTSNCNLNCLHCYMVSDPTQEELSFPEVKNILSQLQQEGCLYLCFSGGEPLLREDFLDIYIEAKNKGFLITVFTNGTLVTKEIADIFKKLPPRRIEITLNGITQETYEKITQVAGSFEKVMQGIKLIKERKLPLTIKSNGMILNKHEILDIKQWVQNLGMPYRFDSILMPQIDGSKKPCALRLRPEEIVKIEYKDQDMIKQNKKILKKDSKRNNQEKCAAGEISFHIDSYGNLRLCGKLRQPYLNLRQHFFKEAFYNFLSPLAKKINNTLSPNCQNCKISRLCRICPARSMLEEGCLDAPIEYFCRVAEEKYRQRELIL